MLAHLSVKGLAVIDSLDIQFDDGFNVITGETGAGKSILIKALGFLLGGKASADWIRAGFSEASVAGVFRLDPSHSLLAYLDSLGIRCDASDVIDLAIRRTINLKARSSAWIGDVAVTNQTLRNCGGHLIDIFSQHEHHTLLNPHHHLGYVDQFLADSKTLQRYRDIHQQLSDKLAELRSLSQELARLSLEKDFLEFRLQQITELNPSVEDFEYVKLVSDQAGQKTLRSQQLSQARSFLDAGDGTLGLSETFWNLVRYLETHRELMPAELVGRARVAAEVVDEISYEISRNVDAVELEPEELENAQARLSSYQNLMRKLRCDDASALIAELVRIQEQLDQIESGTATVHTSLHLLDRLSSELESAAEALSLARGRAAEKIRKFLTRELQELDMKGASIEVEFQPYSRPVEDLGINFINEASLEALWRRIGARLARLGERGAESAQFMLTSNLGESRHALHKIASGGEVSRIMLAIKRCLAAGAESCLLVFDEIDLGISGKVADVVGQKIKGLSDRFQVLCISHLPQVAAYADTHYLVHKSAIASKRTKSQIERLDQAGSIEELARMLSGPEVTKHSLANARSLKERALSL